MSSSDEDGHIKKPCGRFAGFHNFKNPDDWMDSPEVIPMLPRDGWRDSQQQPGHRNSPDCSSPPLYEVELTASDEEDDGSVLELVIPLQKSGYKRVSTSSPIKDAIAVSKFICSMFCCFGN